MLITLYFVSQLIWNNIALIDFTETYLNNIDEIESRGLIIRQLGGTLREYMIANETEAHRWRIETHQEVENLEILSFGFMFGNASMGMRGFSKRYPPQVCLYPVLFFSLSFATSNQQSLNESSSSSSFITILVIPIRI